jgi:hypothetical protein
MSPKISARDLLLAVGLLVPFAQFWNNAAKICSNETASLHHSPLTTHHSPTPQLR